MSWSFGVDEAGRGPVIGSMFAAAVAVPDESILPDGLADSKTLTPSRREELATALHDDDRVAVSLAEITPTRIDEPTTDMNALAVEAHATALSALSDSGVDDATGVLDACDVDAKRFATRVAERTHADFALTAEHRADDRHPLVSAASIVAKVERDAHVADLAAEYGPVGSGYPSDPSTRRFLATYVEEHGQLPACARSSWKTCADVLAAADQSSLAEF